MNAVKPDEFIEQGFVYKGIGRGDKKGIQLFNQDFTILGYKIPSF